MSSTQSLNSSADPSEQVFSYQVMGPSNGKAFQAEYRQEAASSQNASKAGSFKKVLNDLTSKLAQLPGKDATVAGQLVGSIGFKQACHLKHFSKLNKEKRKGKANFVRSLGPEEDDETDWYNNELKAYFSKMHVATNAELAQGNKKKSNFSSGRPNTPQVDSSSSSEDESESEGSEEENHGTEH